MPHRRSGTTSLILIFLSHAILCRLSPRDVTTAGSSIQVFLNLCGLKPWVRRRKRVWRWLGNADWGSAGPHSDV